MAKKRNVINRHFYHRYSKVFQVMLNFSFFSPLTRTNKNFETICTQYVACRRWEPVRSYLGCEILKFSKAFKSPISGRFDMNANSDIPWFQFEFYNEGEQFSGTNEWRVLCSWPHRHQHFTKTISFETKSKLLKTTSSFWKIPQWVRNIIRANINNDLQPLFQSNKRLLFVISVFPLLHQLHPSQSRLSKNVQLKSSQEFKSIKDNRSWIDSYQKTNFRKLFLSDNLSSLYFLEWALAIWYRSLGEGTWSAVGDKDKHWNWCFRAGVWYLRTARWAAKAILLTLSACGRKKF